MSPASHQWSSLVSFSQGLSLQRHVWRSFRLPISCSGFNPREFFLVVSFGRCKFRLCPISVGLILQATIGGVAADFKVLQLDSRVFHFSIASNLVGHFLSKLRSYECRSYKLYFHLWNYGGPNWKFEFRNFLSEEESSWHQAKFEQQQRRALTGENAVFARKSDSDRLKFPSTSQPDRLSASVQFSQSLLTSANAIPVRQSSSAYV